MHSSPRKSRSVAHHVAGRRLVWLFAVMLSANVLASGFPPVANDDVVSVVRGGVVSTLSDGSTSVLDNDFDAENDPLAIFLTRNVSDGQLVLNRDGTFVYQHGGGRGGRDEFRYIIFDGTRFSARATVRIEISDRDPVPPLIIDQQPVSVNEDASLSVNIGSLIVTDPDNVFPRDFTLEVGDGDNYSRSGTTITPQANYNGRLNVPVRVFDGTNFSNLFSLAVTVVPQNDPPFTTGGPPDQEVIEDQRFALAFADFFGDIDANDSLLFSARGLPRSGSLSIDAGDGVLSGTPIAADLRDNAYNVTVTATDSSGSSADIQFRLTVLPNDRADLAVSASVAVNPVTIGENLRWTIIVNNQGPADVEEGELVAQWSTSGNALSLTTASDCTTEDNDSSSPLMRCVLNGLVAGDSLEIAVDGLQDGDGDNSLLAVAVAEDPNTANNSSLIGAQVVALFSEGPTQILGVSAADIAGGDLNGDGLKDLVVSSDETTVFLNSGNRTVSTPGTSLGQDSGGAAVVMLDWNGDTSLDIAVAGVAGAAARVYLNNGSGGFTETIDLQYPNAGAISAAAGADFDQNGFDDLVLTGLGGSRLLQSSGDADFDLRSLPAGPGIDVAIADLNNDSVPDIIVVEVADRVVQLLRNSGNGRDFETQSVQRGSVAGVTGSDLNGDGSADLLLAIDGSDLSIPQSLILMQRSDGSFPEGDVIGASPLSSLLAGDIDGDAAADIVAFNNAGVHQLYRASANGGYVLSPEQIVSAGMRGGLLIDFNNDESLDLIMAGPDSSVVEIHANNGIGRLGLGDRIAPVIELLGESSVSLAVGATFDDLGATATDDIDGNLTEAVRVSGEVNTSVIGQYTLNYSVADKSGNVAATSRVINVGINSGQGGGGGGALSFLLALLLFALRAGRQPLVKSWTIK